MPPNLFAIPGSLLITIGVIVLAVMAIHSGSADFYRASVIAGAVGTFVNFVLFYRWLFVALQEDRRKRESKKSQQDDKPAN